MHKPGERRRLTPRKMLLTIAATGLLPLSAFAKDLPPTPEGAQKLSALFATYLAAPAAGAPPQVVVTPEGAHYAVEIDIANLAAPLSDQGVSVDPAVLKYQLTEQDDGTWHVFADTLPPISVHSKEGAIAYKFDGYKFDGIFDPSLAAFKNGQLTLDKTTADVHTPKVDESIAIGAIRATQTGAPGPNGSALIAAHEDVSDLSLSVSAIPDAAAAPDAKPVPVSFQLATMLADIGIDGAPIRKLLDLWAFASAHPTRAELEANEPAFKALLRAALPASFKLAEKFEMKRIAVVAPQGAFGLAGGKIGFAAATAPGPNASAEYHLAVDGLTLPPGLLPPAVTDLVPTAFNIDVKAGGFDFGAGAEEAIKDMHFAGDGPVIAPADKEQIFAAMKKGTPIVIELSPSHIVAPQIDLTVEGLVRIEGERPSGLLKVHVRNFDKTVAAIKALGPLATPQLLGGLVLAKTLAKSEGDGVLTWIAEYGADGAIKVNGLPLGKAP